MKIKIVYWAPWFPPDEIHHWNILFSEPKKLLNTVLKEVSTRNDNRLKGMIRCPAFSNIGKNTYYVENPIKTEFNLIPQEMNEKIRRPFKIEYISENFYNCNFSNGGNTISYGLPYIFFCEDDLELMLTGPHFSKTSYTDYGNIVPGRFNISRWFRPINLEVLLNKDNYHFKMEENEHMAYFTFLTDNKVELKRFDLNDSLRKISETCANVSDWWSNIPLIKRYDRFLKSKTNRLVMKEIKKQLVE